MLKHTGLRKLTKFDNRENGDHERMRIYWKNEKTIELLKQEYNESR